ncbi:phosphoenolpyruvate carboxykinase (ATP) [Pasteuria penetrans]|uniref:phosphoenolpyruvate carboxykinase (ATP) n=1 Tax=Pasteuria penetrans TaxID=86005 RepID=UPI000FB1A9A0|nr:phosphoenolpyruvate carboxykinase (ATP) [Pasteuria penetrans]
MDTTIKTASGRSLRLGTRIHEHLAVPKLVEIALQRSEGHLSNTGAFCANTGTFTGRVPKNRYIVSDPMTKRSVAWGETNQPLQGEYFEDLLKQVETYLCQREIFHFAGYAGADPAYSLPVHVFGELAWHQLFAHCVFITQEADETGKSTLSSRDPFIILSAPKLQIDKRSIPIHSPTVVVLNFAERVVLIAGTHYAGEIKKSIFTALNFLLPEGNVLPMHCSASKDPTHGVTLFFGSSGTGKTTLSADPAWSLVGDDEHGWSSQGIFNFEGGCYAKCIRLEKEREPQIYQAIRFGAILENVILDEQGIPDYKNGSITENIRAAYPLSFIPDAILPSVTNHPKTIIFLTADAFGVLPPISRLNPEQAMYYFLAGYTSKLAGTEQGIAEPESVFSPGFGAPFLPRAATVYAQLLGEKMAQHKTHTYLVNTGWIGGPYGVGQRVDLKHTRNMVHAAIQGKLADSPHTREPFFHLSVPVSCPGVPENFLRPQQNWPNRESYAIQARKLAECFHQHMDKFSNLPENILGVGPPRT